MTPLRFTAPASYARVIRDHLARLFREIEQTETARLRGDPEAVWPLPGFALDDAPGECIISYQLTDPRTEFQILATDRKALGDTAGPLHPGASDV